MLSDKEEANLAGNSCLSPWHALYTRHQHEKVVAQALSCKGFEVFLPQYGTVHEWKDRRKELQLPLFPNYVFIRGGLERMLILATTPCIHSLVSWGGRLAHIPSHEIEAVRRLAESSLQVKPHPFLRFGDRVRIKSGPLEGIEGILIRKTRGFRLVLSVEMLSESAAVEVDVRIVERLPRVEPIRRDTQRNGASASYPALRRPCAFIIGWLAYRSGRHYRHRVSMTFGSSFQSDERALEKAVYGR